VAVSERGADALAAALSEAIEAQQELPDPSSTTGSVCCILNQRSRAAVPHTVVVEIQPPERSPRARRPKSVYKQLRGSRPQQAFSEAQADDLSVVTVTMTVPSPQHKRLRLLTGLACPVGQNTRPSTFC
jgi:hypothetical protein